jgi:radical SAM protein with 4Fe4S-binding SPASM domain
MMTLNYYLRELKVEVNRECPLKCLHCSSNGTPNASERLEPSRVIDLIREFSCMGGKVLALSGGEPLSYRDLPQIVSVCRDMGIPPNLYTSGVCPNGSSLSPISEEILTLLKQSGARMIFSLHGACANTHDMMTQVTGSFGITTESMRRTLNSGITTEVHIVPTAINFLEIAEMIKLLASIGIKKVSWLRFVPQGRGERNRGLLSLTVEQLVQLAHQRVELQEIIPNIQIRTGSPFNILFPQKPTPCVAGISVLTVRPDGYAVPCDAFKRFRKLYRFSDILRYSLADVWRRSEFLAEVRRIQESRDHSSCTSCSEYRSCNSGCLAQKAIAAGKLTDGKDPDCLIGCAEVESAAIETVPV